MQQLKQWKQIVSFTVILDDQIVSVNYRNLFETDRAYEKGLKINGSRHVVLLNDLEQSIGIQHNIRTYTRHCYISSCCSALHQTVEGTTNDSPGHRKGYTER